MTEAQKYLSKNPVELKKSAELLAQKLLTEFKTTTEEEAAAAAMFLELTKDLPSVIPDTDQVQEMTGHREY